MKKSLALCLMAALLVGMGTSCSKRSNSRVKEIELKENALKIKAAEEKEALTLKIAEEELKAAEQKRRDAAIPVEQLLRSTQEESSVSLSLYQLVLASRLAGDNSSVAAAYEFSDPDHDSAKELKEVEAATGKTTESICKDIAKKNLLKNDSDLVSVDKDVLHRNVDEKVSCRGLSLASNFIDKATLAAMCARLENRKVEVKSLPAKKVAPLDTKAKDVPALPILPALPKIKDMAPDADSDAPSDLDADSNPGSGTTDVGPESDI